MENGTNVEYFVLMGLSRSQGVQVLLFLVFFVLYMVTMAGNLLIILTVNVTSSLNSPMYFFLSNLSFLDLCYPSVTTPKMLLNILSQSETIPFNGCIAQLFLFHFFTGSEVFLLTVMAFDRYVAICNPLRYSTIMSKQVCCLLVFTCWVGGTVHSTAQILLMISLPYCGPSDIDNFFCDIPALLKLACTDTYLTGVLVVSNSGFISLACFSVLLTSYISILMTTRKLTKEGQSKALSTCASHLTVVSLFFGPCIIIYTRPAIILPMDKIVSVFYAVITPMLNPLIYTLRNGEVKTAMKKLISRKIYLGNKYP